MLCKGTFRGLKASLEGKASEIDKKVGEIIG